MTSVHDEVNAPEPVVVYGDIETEAQGLAYGAMVFTVERGGASHPHSHGSEETWWVRAGSGVATVSGKQTLLKTGDRFTVPASTVHHVEASNEGDLTIVAFWWREAAQ